MTNFQALTRVCICLFAIVIAGQALAQSSPGLIFGQVPTAGQWNSYFAAKQDTLGFVPLNKAGDTMQGPLFLAPSTTGSAGLIMTPGVAPTSPPDGSLWTTTTGLFARINGSTVGPFGSTTQLITKTTTSGTSASECGANYQLTGSSFYAFTLNDPTSYPDGCQFFIYNVSPTDGTGVARDIINAGAHERLWPQQAIVAQKSGTTWQIYFRARYKTKSPLTLHVNASTGNDNNDGSSGAPLATQNAAINIVVGNEIDNGFTLAPQVTVLLDTSISENVHFPGTPVAQSGHASILIDGGGHIAGGVSGQPTYALFDNAQLEWRNIKIESPDNAAISLNSNSRGRTKDLVDFGSAGFHLQISEGSNLAYDNDFTISGAAAYHAIVNSGGSVYASSAITMNITADMAFTQFVLAQAGGVADYLGVTINTNGHSITGSRFQADINGLIVSKNLDSNLNYFPGSTAGGLTTGGRYDNLTNAGIVTALTLNITSPPNTANANTLCYNSGTGSVTWIAGACTSPSTFNGDHSFSSADCFNTAFFTGSQHTATVGATGGFTAGCQISIVNQSSSDGMILTVSGSSNRILWPGQSIVYQSNGGTWAIASDPGRWLLASSITMFVNGTGSTATCGLTGGSTCLAGSDSNDGLSINTPFLTLNNALKVVATQVDANLKGVTINLAHGSSQNYAAQCVYGPWIGTSVINVRGDSTAPTAITVVDPPGQYGLQVKDDCTIDYRYIAWADNGTNNGSGHIVVGGTGSNGHLDISDMAFGSLTIGTMVSVGNLGSITVTNGNISLTGGAAGGFFATGGGLIDFNGTTVTAGGTYAFSTAFAFVSTGGIITATTSTFSGITATGPRCLIFGINPMPGYDPNAVFPGNSNCVSNVMTGNLSASALANTATTSAVCYNTSTGLLSYNGTVGTCTVSILSAKNLEGVLSPKEGFDIVMGMVPYRYTMKDGLPTSLPGEQIGFIADFTADKRLVASNPDGSLSGFRYEQYTAALTAAIQYMKAQIDNLRADNDNILEQLKAISRRR